MNNVTSLLMRVLPSFPARIRGSDGLAVDRESADFVVRPDYGSLVQVPSISDMTATFFQAYNAQDDSYSRISGTDLLTNIQSVIIGPTTAAMEATYPAADQIIYFTGVNAAATTGLTSAGRALLDDPDATSQRTTLGLGSAALASASSFATSSQGALADTAVQPGALGNAASKNVGTTADTVAAGNDSRILGAAQKSANLADLTNAGTARSNLSLGGAAVLNVGTAASTVAAGDDERLVYSIRSFFSVTVAQARNLTTLDEVEIRRWSNTSQLCKALYKKVAAQPTHPMKFQDSAGNWFEIAESEINVLSAGATADWTGTTGTNNGPAIQRAVDVGRSVVIPAGEYLTSTIYVRTPYQAVLNFGNLYWNGNGGLDAFPLLIVEFAATSATFFNNGKLDHRGTLWQSATTLPATANRALESCVIMMAPRSRFSGGEVVNGFDNGIGIMRANLSTGAQSPGQPGFAKISDVHTINCGVGMRTHDAGIGPHQAGSGVNLLSGSFAVIENCTDDGSRTNFIADYGAGASGLFVGCVGNGAKLSVSGTVSFEGVAQRPGGFGVYCGTSNVKWIGVQINDCEGWGGWWDAFSARNDIDIAIKNALRGGLLLMGQCHKLTARVRDAGVGAPGQYPAIRLRGAGDFGGTIGDSTDQILSDCFTEGTSHTYGLEVLAGSTGKLVKGRSDGGNFRGTLAPVANNQATTFILFGYQSPDKTAFASIANLQNFANDGAAATGGVPFFGLYRNGSTICIRVT